MKTTMHVSHEAPQGPLLSKVCRIDCWGALDIKGSKDGGLFMLREEQIIRMQADSFG